MQTPLAVAAADPSSTNIWAIANTPFLWICILGVFAVIFVQTVLYAKAATAAAPHIEMPVRELKEAFRAGAVASIGPSLAVVLVAIALLALQAQGRCQRLAADYRQQGVHRPGAAVASQGGAPTHPQWYHNLKAHPDIELMDGERRFPVRARELEGEEREQWWQPCVDAFPPYAEYQTKTDRLIPVFVLEPR